LLTRAAWFRSGLRPLYGLNPMGGGGGGIPLGGLLGTDISDRSVDSGLGCGGWVVLFLGRADLFPAHGNGLFADVNLDHERCPAHPGPRRAEQALPHRATPAFTRPLRDSLSEALECARFGRRAARLRGEHRQDPCSSETRRVATLRVEVRPFRV